LGGNVKYIIAPDMEHHIFLGPWHKAYPAAAVIGPDGLREKRAKANEDDVPFAVEFTAENKDTVVVSEEFNREFDIEYLDSHVNKELVLNKKDERTLIQADLMFNLGKVGAKEQYSKTGLDPRGGGFLSNLWANIMSADAPIWQQRFLWYAASSANRDRFTASVNKIDSWDFDRVIPCHGDVIETDGKKIFETVFQWFLIGKKNSSK
jgi:hypothetical protein